MPRSSSRPAGVPAFSRRAFLGGSGAALLAVAAPALAQRDPLAPDRELMVPVTGGRIYVRINGPLDGPRPPLIMIHGGPGGSHATFLEALPLADERAVILYDQLDSGRSDRPNDPANWRVGRFVDEIDSIRRALSLERVHVLGASWGGTIALEYTARRPAGLASTILQSPLVSTRAWLADANILLDEMPGADGARIRRCERQRNAPGPDCRAAQDRFYALYNRRRPASPAIAAYRARMQGGLNDRIYGAMWGHSEFVSTGTLRTYDGEPLLARLDGPRTLFVVGQYDEARPATVADFARRTPGAGFAVVEDAAHGIFNDNPEAANAVVRRWLRRHDP